MDKNQIAGLVLMLVLLTVYFQFFAPDPPVEPETTAIQQDSTTSNGTATAGQQPEQQLAESTLPDSVKSAQAYAKYGEFALLTNDTEERKVTIENEVAKISFTSKGGKVQAIELKDYKSYNGEPLILFNEASNNMNISLRHSGKRIRFGDLNFNSSVSNRTIQGDDSLSIVYTAPVGEFGKVEQIYTVYGDSYEIGYKIKTSGLNNIIDQEDLELVWVNNLRRLEKDLPQARQKTALVYSQSKDVDDLTSRGNGLEEETLSGPVEWVSFSQKFFTTGIIADRSFQKGYVSMVGDDADTTTVRRMTANLQIPVSDVLGAGFDARFYYGPNNYNILKKVTPGFDANVDLGWNVLKVINKYLIINIFQWLEKYISNYGLIIFIMVILIKLLLSPLTFKSHMSMAKMRVLKPELDELKERIGDDMQKMQVEQMDLYKKAGINPLSGCVPMLLQMPVLFAMFYFFPNSIELRQESFLWAHDLSTYDSVWDFGFEVPFYGDHMSLFTLLMTASTILYTWSNSRVSSVTGPMKTMQYIMPVMFLFFLNNYSSGLTFYYFVSNIVSFGQIALFRKFVNEDKIRAILEENKKKNANKKKSKFASRLEEAMKASEEARRQKTKKK